MPALTPAEVMEPKVNWGQTWYSKSASRKLILRFHR
jgi:hypothetical protein